MKPKAKIQKLGSRVVRSYYHWDLGKVAFGKDEEPRGHNGGMKKGKRKHQNLKTWQGISEKQIKM